MMQIFAELILFLSAVIGEICGTIIDKNNFTGS